MSGYFTINEKLPSMNDVISKNRTNKYAGAKYKADIENMISAYILDAKSKGTLKATKKPCVVRINWIEANKKRDADNIQSSQKFILDALQKCGIIPNDNRKYIKQIYHNIQDGNETMVIVRLEEIDAC